MDGRFQTYWTNEKKNKIIVSADKSRYIDVTTGRIYKVIKGKHHRNLQEINS